MKWFKITSSLLLVLLFTACNNNDEDITTNTDKEVSDEVESTDGELESDPSNTIAD
ncbi:hypothetical protein ACFFIX_08275 [Metabacillus herbersteinensis]|uniref:Uncharacterized protein n=1 Tax=Metabacillus herbersteinensis TaxID=283816 RepID=A0ABV6GE49_9BACI